MKPQEKLDSFLYKLQELLKQSDVEIDVEMSVGGYESYATGISFMIQASNPNGFIEEIVPHPLDFKSIEQALKQEPKQ